MSTATKGKNISNKAVIKVTDTKSVENKMEKKKTIILEEPVTQEHVPIKSNCPSVERVPKEGTIFDWFDNVVFKKSIKQANKEPVKQEPVTQEHVPVKSNCPSVERVPKEGTIFDWFDTAVIYKEKFV